MKLHTIVILVENKFGVLARVAGMFSGRGYNIHSLNVGTTHNPQISRMTIVVREKENVLDQIIRQLEKQVDVIEINDFRIGEIITRELILLKVACAANERGEIVELCNIFGAKIIDVSNSAMTIEMSGSDGKVQHFIDLVPADKITTLVRSGKIAARRLEN